ncbi:unnamed protein product, partial [Symbiodinium sp. CCMP2456]
MTMSGVAESSTTATMRTKDGVPTWSGEAASFTQYEETALLWEQSLTWEKRYTAGPKLVQELTGAAKRYVAGQPAGWVAFRGGVVQLMDHLRKALGKPRVNEVTDLLATYFKGTRRRSGESMNEYITRKTEAYMRAGQALRKVQPHYEARPTTTSASSPWTTRRPSLDYGTGQWGRQWTPASELESSQNPDDNDTAGGSTRPSDGADEPEDPWASYAQTAWNPGYHWGWSAGWRGQGQWDWYASRWSSSSQTSEDPPKVAELLPTFIQGWYLLMDAGLDHGERNLIITALNGNFDPLRVGQELRNQFPEGEVRRRDQGRRHQSYMGELADEMDEDFETEGNSTTDLEAEGMNDEGIALVVDAEQEAQSALAALHEAKRTLKDARFRQKMVKQNRKYYQGNSRGYKPSYAPGNRVRDDSQIECLGCGQQGHRVANCPNKNTAAMATSSADTDQQAPFVCFSGPDDSENFAGFAHQDNQDLTGFAHQDNQDIMAE